MKERKVKLVELECQVCKGLGYLNNDEDDICLDCFGVGVVLDLVTYIPKEDE